MRYRFILPICILIISCSKGEITYENTFYENVSGIKVPGGLRIVETFDNWEFLTGTTFKTDKASLLIFIKKYNLKAVNDKSRLTLWSDAYLKGVKPGKELNKNLFFNWGSKGKENWRYIADTNKGLLWAEIWYPDWSSN